MLLPEFININTRLHIQNINIAAKFFLSFDAATAAAVIAVEFGIYCSAEVFG